MPTKVYEDNVNQAKKQATSRSLFDKFVLVMTIVESLSTIPQLYQVWINKQTVGVSLFTWLAYSLIECVWFIYGLKQKDKAIIGGSLSWGVMELLVVIGLLVNR